MKTFNFIVRFYNVCPKTYKRKKALQMVTAYDEKHAAKIINRHPDLIISIIKAS